jgi:alginate O-acetyltransferase complex protein AlgI
VLWGACHGMFLVLERIFLNKFYDRIGKFSSTLITFFIAVIGWVFLRIEKISDAFLFLRRMFSFSFKNVPTFDSEFYTFFGLAVFFAFFTYFQKGQTIQDSVYINPYSDKRHIVLSFFTVILLVLSMSSITAFGLNPFIYFRF